MLKQSSREEFENIFREYADKHVTGSSELIMKIASYFYETRQLEIDALKKENSLLNVLRLNLRAVAEENAALKAEVERLKAASTPPVQEAFAELVRKQEPLGKEFADVLYSNLNQLYETSEPAQEAVPVAWFDESDIKGLLSSGFSKEVLASPDKGGCCNLPLYAAPQDHKLREAAEKARDRLKEILGEDMTTDDYGAVIDVYDMLCIELNESSKK